MHNWYFRHLRLLLVAIIFPCGLTNCYTLKQAYYQGNMLAHREPVRALVWKDSTRADLKSKLVASASILAFAKQSGLNVGSAYRYYVETPKGRDVVSYLVQAAPEFAMQPKTWNFWVVGEVPYLGFYDQSDRDELAEQLASEGYDVYRGGAEAFSLLGWMDEPLFSSMLARSDTSLAHLLFHELTHRTLWVPGDVAFNENLAEWSAMSLTKQYLQAHGQPTERYDDYIYDRDLYARWVGDLRRGLEDLYKANETLDPARRRQQKADLIRSHVRDRSPKFRDPKRFDLAGQEWNNAVVLAQTIYLPNRKPFDDAFRCSKSKSVGEFLTLLRDKLNNDAPTKALAELCPVSTL